MYYPRLIVSAFLLIFVALTVIKLEVVPKILRNTTKNASEVKAKASDHNVTTLRTIEGLILAAEKEDSDSPAANNEVQRHSAAGSKVFNPTKPHATSRPSPNTNHSATKSTKRTTTNMTDSSQNSTSRKTSPTDDPNYWNWYRIGDGVKRYKGTAGCERYPDSILCDYLKLTNESSNVPVLKQVVEARTKARMQNNESVSLLPGPGDIVVHLRLGDGLCAQNDKHCGNKDPSLGPRDCWNNANDCFRRGSYSHPKEWYYNVVNELLKDTTTKQFQDMYVVSDFKHWTRSEDPRSGNFSTDSVYRDNFRKFMQQKGFRVHFRDNGTPDEDFSYMCMARTFVQGGGSFSRMIGNVVAARGDRVIKPVNATGSSSS